MSEKEIAHFLQNIKLYIAKQSNLLFICSPISISKTFVLTVSSGFRFSSILFYGHFPSVFVRVRFYGCRHRNDKIDCKSNEFNGKTQFFCFVS